MILENSKEHIPFEISTELLQSIQLSINSQNNESLRSLFSELHYADIAEVLDELNLNQATYIIKLLDSQMTSDILSELDEDVREKVLENLSPKEIAEEIKELIQMMLLIY